jgi:hypothetical protein
MTKIIVDGEPGLGKGDNGEPVVVLKPGGRGLRECLRQGRLERIRGRGRFRSIKRSDRKGRGVSFSLPHLIDSRPCQKMAKTSRKVGV